MDITMRKIRDATFDEYATWFFRRAARSGASGEIPPSPEHRLAAFRTPAANGKFHEWFLTARWTVQLLDHVKEMETLMVVSASFTREYRLWNAGEQRLLAVEARNALRYDYFLNDPNCGKHCRYYYLLRTHKLLLREENRLVLISLDDSGKREAPDATYYLHDGFGRSLPYMMLLQEGAIEFSAVEVFLAEKQ